MPTFTVQEIIRATQGALVSGDLAIRVGGVSIDSRTIGVGDAFVAIRGHRLDGHAFVADAAARGAVCLITHTVPDRVPSGVALVLVEDTTRALGRLAAWHRARFSVPVVAVTGSNGKTTTKELIATVLGARLRVLRPRASFNNQWGLPLTLLGLGPEHEALVVEIGTNQRGEVAYLAGIAAPTVGVVTTVAAAHTEYLGSIEGVREEKAALVRALPAAGHAVLNADDPLVLGMARDTTARVITYGTAATADVRAARDITEDAQGLTFTLEAGAARQPVHLPLCGRHNVTNALAAAAAGVALGFGLEEITGALARATPVKGRCVWRPAGPVRVLDDTYNANPAAMRAALVTAAAHRGGGRLIVVLGDMLELGDAAADAHREIGRQVAAADAVEFVGLGSQMRLAVEAARAAGLDNARHAATYEDALAYLLKRLSPDDVVLIKGSRGMRMERVVDALVARLGRSGSR